MEKSSDDLTLVVAEREFLVNRKILVDNATYFRALLHGCSGEAASNRVELKDICDPDAFDVILDYVLNKRVDLNKVSKVYSSILASSVMLNVNKFSGFLEKELFKNWAAMENADSILKLAETLNVRTTLLSHIFNIIRNIYMEMGRNLVLSAEDSPKSYDCPSSFAVIDSLPDLLVDLFGTGEACIFVISSIDDVNYYQYVTGVVSWLLSKELDESRIRNVIRCLGIHYLNHEVLLEFIANQEENKQKALLEQEVKRYIENTRMTVRNSVLRLCVGWEEHAEFYKFNLQNWKWDLVEFTKHDVDMVNLPPPYPEGSKCLCMSLFDRYDDHYYAKAETFASSFCSAEMPEHLTSGSLKELRCVYSSGQHQCDGKYTLLIYELNLDDIADLSVVFRGDMPCHVVGCHILRLGDVLHGLVTYTANDDSFTISHFALQRNDGDTTWLQSSFLLDPLFTGLRKELTPVAMASSKKGFLVLFRIGQEYLWLAEYNLNSACLEPLAIIPMPRKKSTKALKRLGSPPFVPFHDPTAKTICTFNFACCSDTHVPLFHLISCTGVPGNHDVHVCPFLSNLNLCAGGVDHIPKAKSTINLFSYTSLIRPRKAGLPFRYIKKFFAKPKK